MLSSISPPLLNFSCLPVFVYISQSSLTLVTPGGLEVWQCYICCLITDASFDMKFLSFVPQVRRRSWFLTLYRICYIDRVQYHDLSHRGRHAQIRLLEIFAYAAGRLAVRYSHGKFMVEYLELGHRFTILSVLSFMLPCLVSRMLMFGSWGWVQLFQPASQSFSTIVKA